MTPLTKTVRRVTLETYGYGKQARKLVVSFEKGDLISIREHGRRSKDTARLYDVLWWMNVERQIMLSSALFWPASQGYWELSLNIIDRSFT